MTSEKFLHRLILPSVRLMDSGEYTVVAGSSMSKGHLGVEGRDVKISEPGNREITVSYTTHYILNKLSQVHIYYKSHLKCY